jgi:hypothetical protein
MPCAGPEISEQEVDAAYEDIMDLLRDRYDIQNCKPHFALCGFIYGNMLRARAEHNKKFKEALRELFILQSAEDF